MLIETSVVAAFHIQDPIAIIKKNMGKVSESAARASVDMYQAKYVSTILYIVLKKNPTLAGIAIILICFVIFHFVRSICFLVILRLFHYIVVFNLFFNLNFFLKFLFINSSIENLVDLSIFI
ncbi:MAG: hypothetical protein ACOZBL_05935 [Patescibacteria group bacterium]